MENGLDGASRKSLPRSSILTPLSYNIYTYVEPVDNVTHRFIYADNLCTISEEMTSEGIEYKVTNAMSDLSEYYTVIHLCENPCETQEIASHPKNHLAGRVLKVRWDNKVL